MENYKTFVIVSLLLSLIILACDREGVTIDGNIKERVRIFQEVNKKFDVFKIKSCLKDSPKSFRPTIMKSWANLSIEIGLTGMGCEKSKFVGDVHCGKWVMNRVLLHIVVGHWELITHPLCIGPYIARSTDPYIEQHDTFGSNLRVTI